MPGKSGKHAKSTVKAKKPTVRKPKAPSEIKKELREQQALDTSRSEVEDYAQGPGNHFRM